MIVFPTGSSEPPREASYADLRDEINRLAAKGGGVIKVPGPTRFLPEEPDGCGFATGCRVRIVVNSASCATDEMLSGLYLSGAYTWRERAAVRLRNWRWQLGKALNG